MHKDYKSSKCYSGDKASLYNELLQDSYNVFEDVYTFVDCVLEIMYSL